jgi:hypothetical protein
MNEGVVLSGVLFENGATGCFTIKRRFVWIK